MGTCSLFSECGLPFRDPADHARSATCSGIVGGVETRDAPSTLRWLGVGLRALDCDLVDTLGDSAPPDHSSDIDVLGAVAYSSDEISDLHDGLIFPVGSSQLFDSLPDLEGDSFSFPAAFLVLPPSSFRSIPTSMGTDQEFMSIVGYDGASPATG